MVNDHKQKRGRINNKAIAEKSGIPVHPEKNPCCLPNADCEMRRRLEILENVVGDIYHDLNNLLGSILGNTEICMEEVPEDSLVRECLDDIHNTVHRAIEYVSDLDRIRGPVKNRENLSRDGISKVTGTIPVDASGCFRARIMMVDDEAVILQVFKRILEQSGYRMEGFLSPLDALNEFKRNFNNYDLVITDLVMPEMGGNDLLHHLKRIRPDIPVIVCTGQLGIIHDSKSEDNDVDLIVRKPVSQEELLKMLSHFFPC